MHFLSPHWNDSDSLEVGVARDNGMDDIDA